MGTLLAAIQYVPLGLAARGSARSAIIDADFWTFHPLALLELVVPHFYGDYFQSNLRELAWMLALNSQRDPFYYTMYIGVPIALLAAIAMASGRTGTRFWTVVVVLCAVASLGAHTPIYPVLQAILPPLKSFRFPVKYLSLAAFGLAALAAIAFEWMLDGDVPPPSLRRVIVAALGIAGLTYIAVAWVLIAPALPIRGFHRLAIWAGVPSPVQGAEFLLFRARPLLTSLLLKLICATFLLWVAAASSRERASQADAPPQRWRNLRVVTGRERRLAQVVLSVFVVVDLLVSNGSVNPTTDPKVMQEPDWARQIPKGSHERVYIGGRLEGYVNTSDEDAPKYATTNDQDTIMEQRTLVVSEYVFQPSGFGLRESMSYDLPILWPIDFSRTHSLFMVSSRAARLRFLQRVGTRYVLLPTPPYPGATPLARMHATDQMALYDLGPQQRVMIAPDALIGPSIEWQIQGMFLQRFHPSDGVLVSEPPPPPAGFPNAAAPASATFLEDGINRVVVRAALPADGYLALFDTYDPDWKVKVDESPAPLMRANGIFRAVHLARGTHTVSFEYHPSAFYRGAQVTAVTALVLIVACLWERRRR
jgi:hypothetical protein